MRREAKSLLLLALWLVLVPVTSAQDAELPSPPVEMPQGVQNMAWRLVKMHLAWGPQISTPKTSLELTEISRSGDIISYSLHARGLPPGKVYSILSWPITHPEPVEMLTGVTFDATGLAICAGSPGTCATDKLDDDIALVMRPVPGEPVRIGIVSEDGATKVMSMVVPVPIRGSDRGCQIDAVMLLPGAAVLLIEGSGFPPNSELKMVGNSEGEIHQATKKVDGAGEFKTVLLPAKLGLNHGKIKLNWKSPGCSPSLTVPWISQSGSSNAKRQDP